MKNLTITEQISSVRQECRFVFDLAYQACTRAISSVKKAIRSCLWVRTTASTLEPTGVSRTVYPLEYNKNNPMSGFNAAALGWSRQAQDAIRDYYECEDDSYARQFVGQQLARLARVEQEIAMEELHCEALQLLSK